MSGNILDNIVNKMSKFFKKVIEIFCAIVLMSMILFITVGVFFRYVLRSSLTWIPEVTMYFLIGLSLIGAALALEKEGHISVSFIYDKFSDKIRFLLDILKIILSSYYAYVMVRAGLVFADTGSRGLFTNLPGFFPRMAIPISGGLMIIFLINKLRLLLRGAQ